VSSGWAISELGVLSSHTGVVIIVGSFAIVEVCDTVDI
jgi:hypothetical protein